MTPAQIGFLVLAAIAVFGAVGTVFFGSPVRAALALVLNFFTLGLLYFTLGAQMLGISQIMVYAGAIMVLFLFVIMILKSDAETDQPQTRGAPFWIGFVATILIGGSLLGVVIAPLSEVKPANYNPAWGAPQTIGWELPTTYVLPFVVVSLLLTAGVVGSIILAKRRI